ncbi:hypothetical protein M378DRAFT_156448 [Amanita muscaria Koide BX008]|uniref:Uncharacterized protein n=1 Tax=Amanita muscaria (strain Koide BX008) TaxID=946122 RepID=A0A0C2T391_AMAMK|nr:hypothetical protein M378DRAFT_156448 [Amanita muscaria Koide BX008]
MNSMIRYRDGNYEISKAKEAALVTSSLPILLHVYCKLRPDELVVCRRHTHTYSVRLCLCWLQEKILDNAQRTSMNPIQAADQSQCYDTIDWPSSQSSLRDAVLG